MSDVLARLVEALVDRYTIERELGRGGIGVAKAMGEATDQRTLTSAAGRAEVANPAGRGDPLGKINSEGDGRDCSLDTLVS